MHRDSATEADRVPPLPWTRREQTAGRDHPNTGGERPTSVRTPVLRQDSFLSQARRGLSDGRTEIRPLNPW